MVLTQDDKMLLTPTYHAFSMFKGHKDALLMPSHLSTEDYEFDGERIPAISSSASISDDGVMTLTLCNVNPNKSVSLDITILGKSFTAVQDAHVLTAPAVNSINTFDEPEIVKPSEFTGYEKESDQLLKVDLPSKSVVVLRIR
jgi:alpha-N-arabinofuranosidase